MFYPLLYLRYDDIYRPKRSFGQGNIFTRVCDSVHRGEGGVPDQPPPGPGRYTPLQAGTPPFQAGTPLDQAGTPPLQAGTPRQVHPPTRYPQQVHPPAGTPPWQVHPPQQVHPPAGTPPSRYTPRQVNPPAGTPPSRYTPWQVHPPGRYTPLAGTPPSRQVHPPAGTPLPRQVHLPPSRYTPLQAGTPPLPGRYTPPPETADPGILSTIGGTHPTGMHSCVQCFSVLHVELWIKFIQQSSECFNLYIRKRLQVSNNLFSDFFLQQ